MWREKFYPSHQQVYYCGASLCFSISGVETFYLRCRRCLLTIGVEPSCDAERSKSFEILKRCIDLTPNNGFQVCISSSSD